MKRLLFRYSVYTLVGCLAAVGLYFLTTYLFQQPDTMVVAFVGDTGLGDKAEEFIAKNGLHASFKRVKAVISDVDFLIGNCESPIGDPDLEPVKRKRLFLPKQDPKVAKVYADLGFSAFSLANNHTLDFKRQGLRQTRQLLETEKIAVFGAGKNLDGAREPFIMHKGDISVGVLGYFKNKKYYRDKKWYAGKKKAGALKMTKANLLQDISKLTDKSIIPVVFVHWGLNYRPITQKQERMAVEAVDAGADLVLGHGPHVCQKVEIIDGTPVLFSLGNFVWHARGRFSKSPVGKKYPYGLVAKVEFQKEGIKRISLTPILINNNKVKFVPRPVKRKVAKKLFNDILSTLDTGYRLVENTAVIDLK